ncbi:cardiolipin synthase [Gryllotalpicola sp.]|uniref:cardiolipin synthase n=1 Tax=Gryllotalpicola sp. TaxID=1932787 RepID=UPI00263A2BBA|nr:cardiolipin synthase [Gryllotalpicola sp.]
MGRGYLTTIALVLLLLIDFAFRIVAIIVVPRNRRPSSATAWLLAINIIPYLGLLVFLLIGSYKLPRGRRRKQQQINQFILESTEGSAQVSRAEHWPSWLKSVVLLNRNLGAMPLVGGNTADLLTDYQRSLDAMVEAVDRAERTVHAEFYIMALDATTEPFFKALENAVRRGVTVRVLLDHLASLRAKGHFRTIRRLNALAKLGLVWHYMLPIQPWRGKYQRFDLRNHRKLLVVDGIVGFLGSQNIIDASYNKRGNLRRGLQWKELVARLEGPIVAGLNAIFITDWYAETDELLRREVRPADARPVADPADEIDCQLVPSGPGFRGENNLRLFLSLLYYARERIVITSPYFVPDESMLTAITTARERGVAIDLFVSEISDQVLVYHAQRSYYEQLLRAGVRIWMYRAPTILHAKHFTIDDEVAVIGSSNMDIRSFQLNAEISLMVRSRRFVAELRAIEESYRASSRELTLDEWLRQPLRAAIVDNLARLTSALQ